MATKNYESLQIFGNGGSNLSRGVAAIIYVYKVAALMKSFQFMCSGSQYNFHISYTHSQIREGWDMGLLFFTSPQSFIITFNYLLT